MPKFCVGYRPTASNTFKLNDIHKFKDGDIREFRQDPMMMRRCDLHLKLNSQGEGNRLSVL